MELDPTVFSTQLSLTRIPSNETNEAQRKGLILTLNNVGEHWIRLDLIKEIITAFKISIRHRADILQPIPITKQAVNYLHDGKVKFGYVETVPSIYSNVSVMYTSIHLTNNHFYKSTSEMSHEQQMISLHKTQKSFTPWKDIMYSANINSICHSILDPFYEISESLKISYNLEKESLQLYAWNEHQTRCIHVTVNYNH